MTEPLPSPKSRLRAVYSVPPDVPRRTEKVVYQLEDTGHPVLRLRPTVRQVDDDGETRYQYRVDAFSRISGLKLGSQALVAPLGSLEAFAAESRQFQTAPFREAIDELSGKLISQYAEAEATARPPA